MSRGPKVQRGSMLDDATRSWQAVERRQLMAERDAALKAGNIAKFQELTSKIARLPMKGVKPLTEKDIERWNGRTR